MNRYLKDSPRLTVKCINAENNEVIFEVFDRNLMDIRDFFSDVYVTQLVNESLKGKEPPEEVLVLVVGDYKLYR